MADIETLQSSIVSTASGPLPSILSSPKYSHLTKKAVGRQDSSDSSVGLDTSVDQGAGGTELKGRPSISTESISFNFLDGNFDSHGAFKALSSGNGDGGGMTPSSTSSSIKTLSFHSEKELEDFLDGRSSSEDEGASSEAAQQRRKQSIKDSSASKTSTLRSMWSATLGRASKPAMPQESSVQYQGDLEFEDRSSKWKTRTWVLTGTVLGYQKKRSTMSVKSAVIKFEVVIDLNKVVNIYHDPSCFIVGENCFAVDLGTKRYFFKAASRAEMVSWMVAIAKQKKKLGASV